MLPVMREFIKSEEHKVCVLLGPGGMGKTFLTYKLMMEYKDNNENKEIIPVYIELKQYDKQTVKECVKKVLEGFDKGQDHFIVLIRWLR